MRNNNKRIRIRNYRSIELLLWLLILLVTVIISLAALSLKKNSYEYHNIFLEDIDGLIVGSPVNLMGVPVGHVTKIKIVDNGEVFVRFLLKDKSVKLPKGTIANVEFSGMAGSKSVELYPPNPEYVQRFGLDSDNFIVIARQQRLKESWSILYDMFKNIGSISTKVTTFNDDVKNAQIGKDKIQAEESVDNFLEFYANWVNNIQKEFKSYKNCKNEKGNIDGN